MLVPKLLLIPIKIRIFGPKRPNLVQNMHIWSLWAKYWHFLPISSNARPKNNAKRCLGGFSVVWVTKLRIFLTKNNQIWPEIGIFGHVGPGLAGSFGALLVGWLVVVARRLYLSRHLSTLCIIDNVHGITPKEINSEIMYRMC